VPQIYPLTQEDVGRLGTTVRPQADNAFERCSLHKVGSGLADEPDAMSRQLLNELIAGQRPVVRENIAEGAESSCIGVLVQTQFSTPSPTSRNKHGTQQRQEPAKVFCRQQEQRTTHTPCAHHRALLHPCVLDIGSYQASTTHTHRERCCKCILRLQAT